MKINIIKIVFIYHAAMPQCPTSQMEESFVRTVRANCGVLLSPKFPGLVGPGLWSWTLQAPVDAYLVLHVYYVRGPGVGQSTGERLRGGPNSFTSSFRSVYLCFGLEIRHAAAYTCIHFLHQFLLLLVASGGKSNSLHLRKTYPLSFPCTR